MKLFGIDLPWSKKANGDVLSIDQVIRRFEAIYETAAGVSVTCDNCEQAPTVKAIITAITRRFAVTPVHVYLKTQSKGREKKEIQPNHPVERLLSRPNDWQARTSYWMDAASRVARYGNFYAFKARGLTGPIRRLEPLHPGSCRPHQNDDLSVVYKVTMKGGRYVELDPSEVHHVRSAARDGVEGDSPVIDVRGSIAMEIAAESFGASFFGNGAMPGVVFEYMEGSQGFPTDVERQAFIADFHEKYNKRGRFRAIMPPKGVKVGQSIPIENDKAQFLQLRQYQRTVIAGAWGCPPHLVGDLSKGTFNNVEMQGREFSTNVILPIGRMFEAAMEKDLLTDEDRRAGIIIRFNYDAVIAADFKSRQEGQAIQRQNGVINANEWRENEGMNPRSDEGGEEYYATGPSGQTPAGTTSGGGSSDDDPEDDGDAATD